MPHDNMPLFFFYQLMPAHQLLAQKSWNLKYSANSKSEIQHNLEGPTRVTVKTAHCRAELTLASSQVTTSKATLPTNKLSERQLSSNDSL